MAGKKKLIEDALTAAAKATGIIPGTFPGSKLPSVGALANTSDKFVYHSGLAKDIPNMKYGIDPQIGPWVKEVLSSATDDDDLIREIQENAVPVSWWSKEPSWAVVKVARELDKPVSDVTPEELAQYGHVALVPKKDPEAEHMFWVGEEGLSNGPYSYVEDITGKKVKAYNTDLFSGNYGPEGVERNEYITPRSIEPYLHLTGDELVEFLRKTGNFDKASGGPVREGYQTKGRVLGNIVDQALDVIRAYHASPHDFDKFEWSPRTSRTGEGAQSYGAGLYFAESPAVSGRGGTYDQQFTRKLQEIDRIGELGEKMGRVKIGGKPSTEYGIENDPDFIEAIKAGNAQQYAREKLDRWHELAADETYPFRDYAAEKTKAWEKLWGDLYSGAEPYYPMRSRIYEVDIKANPSQLLDWDKPLAEQSSPVLEALGYKKNISDINALRAEKDKINAKLGAYSSSLPKISGSVDEQYDALFGGQIPDWLATANQEINRIDREIEKASNPIPDITGEKYLRSEWEKIGKNKASEDLLAKGIPGVKYYDANSRLGTEGTRNFVISDDKLIDLRKKYEEGGSVKDEDSWLDAATTVARNAADKATFGTSKYAAAGADYLTDAALDALGYENDADFDRALAEQEYAMKEGEEKNPAAAGAGDIIGYVAPYLAIGPAEGALTTLGYLSDYGGKVGKTGSLFARALGFAEGGEVDPYADEVASAKNLMAEKEYADQPWGDWAEEAVGNALLTAQKVLPTALGGTGEVGITDIARGAYEGGKDAVMFPGDVISGKQALYDEYGRPLEQAVGRSFNAASTVGGAASVVPRPANSLGVFGGIKARTADKNKLAEAQIMERDGIAEEEIYKKTGWFRGNDEQWRFEIPDIDATVDPTKFRMVTSSQGTPYQTTTLSEYLNHPEFFTAYPEFKNMPVNEFFSSDTRGYYMPRYERGTINPSISDPYIALNLKELSDAPKQRSTLLHEIQHAIQQKEGFSPGSNQNLHAPDTVVNPKRRIYEAALANDPDMKSFQAVLNSSEYKDQLRAANELFNNTYKKRFNAIMDEEAATGKNLNDQYAALSDEYEALVSGKFPALRAVGELSRKLQERGIPHSEPRQYLTPFEAYYQTAGEVEARNVQERRDKPREELRETYPRKTQDYPDTEQLIDWNDTSWRKGYADGGAVDDDEDIFDALRLAGKTVSTGINRYVNPIRRLLGVETEELPQGVKEVDYGDLYRQARDADYGDLYRRLMEATDNAALYLGGADPSAKRPMKNPVSPSGKIVDRVPQEGADIDGALRIAKDVGGSTPVMMEDAKGNKYDAQGNVIPPTTPTGPNPQRSNADMQSTYSALSRAEPQKSVLQPDINDTYRALEASVPVKREQSDHDIWNTMTPEERKKFSEDYPSYSAEMRRQDVTASEKQVQAMPENLRSMTHPLSPVQTSRGVGKIEMPLLGINYEFPTTEKHNYITEEVDRPVESTLQSLYDFKTIPLYSNPFTAGPAAAIDVAEGLASGDPTTASLAVLFGPGGKYAKAAGIAGINYFMDPANAEAGPARWFSKAMEIARAIPMEKMTGQQALAMLRKGVSPEELRWTGADTFLPQQKQITKQDLVDYLEKNRVNTEDIILADRSQKYPYKSAEGWQNAIARAERAGNFDEAERLTLAWEEYEGLGGFGSPRYRRHSTLGGEDYKETLITLPTNEYGRLFQSGHWEGYPNVIGHIRTQVLDVTPPGANRPYKAFNVDEAQSDYAKEGREIGFSSAEEISKREEEVRAVQKEREKYQSDLRAEGEKIAALEWEAERQLGPFPPVSDRFARQQRIDEKRAMLNSNPDYMEAYSRHKELQQKNDELIREELRLSKNIKGVPSAPYVASTQNWTDLSVKKALDQAIDAGADYFTYTPGKAQAARYSLRNAVDELHYSPSESRLYGRKDGRWVFDQKVEPDKLSKYIGSAVADELLKQPAKTSKWYATPRHVLSGQQLELGGEGMIDYYDNIYKKRVEKVVKDATGKKVQWEVIPVQTADGPREQLGFRLTDDMKEARFSDFNKGGRVTGGNAYDNNQAVDSALALTREF